MSTPPPGDRPAVEASPTMLLVLQGRRAADLLEGRLREIGVTLRHVGILGHLAASPGLSFSDLAGRARITVQSVHTIVGGLVADGLVDAADRTRGRAATLQLTDAGRDRLAAARRVVAAVDAERAQQPGWSAVGAALLAVPGPPLPD